MPDVLRLEVTDYEDLTRWRWVLKAPGGAFLADHEIRLERHAPWEHEAFLDLRRYISCFVAPGKGTTTAKRPGSSLPWATGSAWKSSAPVSAPPSSSRSPATVEVILPEGAERVAYLPLEAVRIQGRSLAGHDITLVIRPLAAENNSEADLEGPATACGVLGLFSLPEGSTALNLRRERQSLTAP